MPSDMPGGTPAPRLTDAHFAPAVLIATPKGALVREPDGRIVTLTRREAEARARAAPPLLAHMPHAARRLRVGPFPALDALELFAFVRPARFCVPTPRGLARALGIEPAPGHEGEAEALLAAARMLLAELPEIAMESPAIADMARLMAAGGWTWGPQVLAALGLEPEAAEGGAQALAVWRSLPEWAEEAPEPPPAHFAVSADEARARLAELVGRGGGAAFSLDSRAERGGGAFPLDSSASRDGAPIGMMRGGGEARPEQADYATAVAQAFAPRREAGMPEMVLAEAETGTGKTLGYIAPASVWAEKNKGAVWISTFTRNLQRQIDQELDRLYPDPVMKARLAVVRKGRENYLCLLNLEDAVTRAGLDPREGVALGLMARWAAASRDGDMVGGDFPAWLIEILGAARTIGLADRRGECIYAACPHYHKCFIERTVRRARRAEIVVANHALVMAQAALSGLDDAFVPTRYVFDEGHHLFAAADSAFAAHLTGWEASELRRWLAGAEDRGRSRARGLARRIGDIAEMDGEAGDALKEAVAAAQKLPGAGWLTRIADGAPRGGTEAFLARVRAQVLARARGAEAGYTLEAEARPLGDGVAEAAANLDYVLQGMAEPLGRLIRRLARLLDDRADELDAATRLRIEGAVRTIEHRAAGPLNAWRAMLAALNEETPEDFVDWFGIERAGGREVDVGMHRHWIDPTRPLADTVYAEAHGVVVTSATLTDSTGDVEADWAAAEARTGARHLPRPAMRARHPSPFDYATQARVYVVTDVDKDDADAVAGAYRALFLAARGGALGLFTSIARLRATHERIAPALDDAGLALYAQHVDAMDTPTLVDIFREDENSCLLGTDAVRDGVDVPGRSLRLIVFDRTPWPRPDILHRARKDRFGGRAYDEMLTRLRLKQAFGRLIRRAGDHGGFVLLDRGLPSRFHRAFPDGVPVARVGLKEAVEGVRGFLE
jgi:ATP-dependent DNA helicase DinG